MRRLTLTGVAAAVVLLSTSATSLSAQVGTFRFKAGSGVSAFGVSVGTYKGQLDHGNIDIYCVDFLNRVRVGDVYQVNITSLRSGADLSKTRYGWFNDDGDRYRQAAWLSTQFAKVPKTSNQWGSIQAAIWHLTTPGFPTVSNGILVAMNTWLDRARGNFRRFYYDNAFLLTDVAVANCRAAAPTSGPWTGCGHQEHIYVNGDLTATPEPATLMLLAAGLVGMSGATLVRRRWRRSVDDR